MFCIKCGKQNPDEAKFCIGCGAKLIRRNDVQEEKPDHEKLANEKVENEKAEKIISKKEFSYNKTAVILLLTGICCSLLCIGIIAAVFSKGKVLTDALGKKTIEESVPIENEPEELEQQVAEPMEEEQQETEQQEIEQAEVEQGELEQQTVTQTSDTWFPEGYEDIIGVYSRPHDDRFVMFRKDKPVCIWRDSSSGISIRYEVALTEDNWKGEGSIHQDMGEDGYGVDISVKDGIATVRVGDDNQASYELEAPRDEAYDDVEQFYQDIQWMAVLNY
ncbi:zinc-ribbon domain-containing protein [Anaeromicropila populeti]|uniref:Zinc-ribbon domain-containing protein n=1 Tax=Anaeromicropila populeti TaxID=37658 RepID=A0A1I6K800_9FIRM|nr:zinc ribbon domain-containing protein [Anaeromicropila populeti]SFR87361.1 zinc-ribbon domain-containing protein [Anaeromicropila populeti]